MKPKAPGKLVYSSEQGRVCARCGWPAGSCRCSTNGKEDAEEPIPARVTARLRIEKKGRGGKTVTLVEGLPRNASFLGELAADLKKACGVGGAVVEGAIELQGDQRERLKPVLERKGLVVR